MSRDDYLYAAGVIRFLENKLLNLNDVERMIDSPDLDSSFKVFHDTDYFDNVLDVEPRDFLKALDADLEQVKEKIITMVPDKNLIAFLFMRFDFHNLKLLLKAKYSDQNLDQYASDLGLQNYDKLKAVVFNNANEDIKAYLRIALDYFYTQQNKNKNEVTSSQIDNLVDQIFYQEYKTVTGNFNSSFIKDLVKMQIDIANIKIFIRSKNLNRSKEKIAENIFTGGNIKVNEFVINADLSLDDSLPILIAGLSGGINQAILKFIKHKSLEELDKNLENVEMSFVRQVKFIDYGPELVIAYFMAKKNAIRNIRLIMTAKINNINSQEVKKLVREIY